MMKTVLLMVALLALSVCSANRLEAIPRLLVGQTRASTFVKLATTVLPLSVPVTCAVHVGVAGSCRRRRGIEEQPIIVHADEGIDISELVSPAKPSLVETTLMPQIVTNISPSTEEDTSAQLNGSLEPLDADNDINSRKGRAPFGLTVYYKTTSTMLVTAFSTILSGTKSFVVSICTPSGFPYPKC